MRIHTDRTSLKLALASIKMKEETIAFVPTMGALHGGHIDLIEYAREIADCVVVSIFVNPTQFGENEDFDIYPRDEQQDYEICEEFGVDMLYFPQMDELYPQGPQLSDIPIENADILEGASRPGFFHGVVTVVDKLFDHVEPHFAIFGEKDYQQLCMVKQLAAWRGGFPQIIGHPTGRETDGLAFSSRNVYLDRFERHIAPILYQILQQTREKIMAGVDAEDAIAKGKEALLEAKFAEVEYLTLVDAENFGPPQPGQEQRLVCAVQAGTVRLLDNIDIPAMETSYER